jgi:hypothetical protein
MRSEMSTRRALLYGAIFAVLLLGGASGCGATVSAWTSSSMRTPDRLIESAQARATTVGEQTQRPSTCQIAPPQINVPTGEWTAIKTILSTNAIDVCKGERLVRPMDFRRRCNAGHCKTYLYTVSYYGIMVADVLPARHGRYLATLRPQTVPCPHRPGEDTGTNQDRGAIELWWSPNKQILHGLGRQYQVGACGGGPAETSSYEAKRTNPTAKPPAEGP